ncbi:MAG: hypothetical protein U0W65_09495 [Bacteroidia bacterium]
MAIFKKKYFFLLVLVVPFVMYGQKKDSINTKYLALYIAPSQILFGDIPIGIEQKLSKKLHHECFVQTKISSPILNLYDFNKGFGVKYFLKYDLTKSKTTNFFLDIGYSFSYLYFKNKMSRSPIQNNDINGSQKKYNMSLLRINNALITGFSFQQTIYKKIYTGLNLFFLLGKNKLNYEIKDDEFAKDYSLTSPYSIKSTNNFYNINLIIKLGYEIY